MAITTKQHGNTVTITLDGEHFETLQRAADALRKLDWCGGDDTPETVCREFVAWGLRDEFDSPRALAEVIIDCSDYKANGNAELEKARIEETRRVFEDAGLLSDTAELA